MKGEGRGGGKRKARFIYPGTTLTLPGNTLTTLSLTWCVRALAAVMGRDGMRFETLRQAETPLGFLIIFNRSTDSLSLPAAVVAAVVVFVSPTYLSLRRFSLCYHTSSRQQRHRQRQAQGRPWPNPSRLAPHSLINHALHRYTTTTISQPRHIDSVNHCRILSVAPRPSCELDCQLKRTLAHIAQCRNQMGMFIASLMVPTRMLTFMSQNLLGGLLHEPRTCPSSTH